MYGLKTCGSADNEKISSIAERAALMLASEETAKHERVRANKGEKIESGMTLNSTKIPNQQILCQEQF